MHMLETFLRWTEGTYQILTNFTQEERRNKIG